MWLIKSILPHKSRWLFFLRQHLMTLGQTSTSALEGVNHTIKVKSSKVVTPNMSLLESYKTMDCQQESRMILWGGKAMADFERNPTWTDTQSSKILTKISESQLQQNLSQKSNYTCKVITHTDEFGEIHMVQNPKVVPFCTDCSDQKTCCKCSNLSPITKFHRRRTIKVVKISSGIMKVSCSCPYQTTNGIICRHLSCFFNIVESLFHIRWKTKFGALFLRTGHEKYTEEIQKNFLDHSLTINKTQFDHIMLTAHKVQNGISFLPEEDHLIIRTRFKNRFQSFQNSKIGIINFTDNNVFNPNDDLDFGEGILSQELSQESKDNNPNITHTAIMSGTSRYVDGFGRFKQMCMLSENRSDIALYFDKKFNELYAKTISMSHKSDSTEMDDTPTNKEDNDEMHNEFISVNGSVDSSEKCVRKRSFYEFNRR